MKLRCLCFLCLCYVVSMLDWWEYGVAGGCKRSRVGARTQHTALVEPPAHSTDTAIWDFPKTQNRWPTIAAACLFRFVFRSIFPLLIKFSRRRGSCFVNVMLSRTFDSLSARRQLWKRGATYFIERLTSARTQQPTNHMVKHSRRLASGEASD
uniref:Putative secreted peptide n=1 Tax=Anopheles braziliensis TaxID=58242 RepID=A0A2M3ZUW0_9DIPT